MRHSEGYDLAQAPVLPCDVIYHLIEERADSGRPDFFVYERLKDRE
jgi:hypothetical protein